MTTEYIVECYVKANRAWNPRGRPLRTREEADKWLEQVKQDYKGSRHYSKVRMVKVTTETVVEATTL